MYRLADLVEFPKIDMLLRINWENNSISLFFLTGRSLISSSNFIREATSANLISLVKNLVKEMKGLPRWFHFFLLPLCT
jgi:hypothetical protein